MPVLINELQLDQDSQQAVAVELYNPTNVDADVAGWLLTNQAAVLPANLRNAPPGYRLPDGSHVPAGGYLVVPIALTDSPFQLRAKAELLTLFSASANGRLSGYLHNVSFNIPPTGVALGRLVNSDGEAYFVPQRG